VVKRLLAFLVLGIFLAPAMRAQNSVISKLRNSKHDFSVSSGATLKATDEDALCLFCHTPHNARPAAPLWNHAMSEGYTYQVYSSSTLKASVSQPQSGDSSKLCLSCHDGTVALGDTVNNGMIPFQNVALDQKMPVSSRANLAGAALDFADDHPFAFEPDPALNPFIRLPASEDPVRLDHQGRVQCTSCHDPHDEDRDPVVRRFLVRSNSASAICLACHDLKGGAGANLWSWSGAEGEPSAHKTSVNAYTEQTNAGVEWLGSHTGYTTVATNACAACHRSHTAHESVRLLKGQTDQTCFQCHDGNPLTGLRDMKSQFTSKMYVHPSLGPQANHDLNEAPDQILTRHAACSDCHNPHAARPSPSGVVPPQLPGALLGVSGIAADGSPRDPRRGGTDALYEYETCFKCHSYNPNKPQLPGYQAYGPRPTRQVDSSDLRVALASGVSWHPVTRPRGLSAGPGGAVPSLLSAPVDASGAPIPGRTLSGSTQISCTDCHANDTGRALGSGYDGPAGPHGSNVIHILERGYIVESAGGTPGQTSHIPYSASNYAMCFKCHSEQSLKNDESFPSHWKHMQVASCATCHDAHGVPSGSAVNHGSLINFDLNIVAPAGDGTGPYWTDLTPASGSTVFRGSCSLTCHGADHRNVSY
jgi:predicted CXXCH cytochrome family protein